MALLSRSIENDLDHSIKHIFAFFHVKESGKIIQSGLLCEAPDFGVEGSRFESLSGNFFLGGKVAEF